MTNLDSDDLHLALDAVRRYRDTTGDLRAYRVAAHLEDAITSANGSPGTTTVHDGFVDTTVAAQRLGCSERWVRDIAPRIGGIKHGGRWLIPTTALPEENN